MKNIDSQRVYTRKVLNTGNGTVDKFVEHKVLADTIKQLRKHIFQLEQQLVLAQHAASHDKMTGLPNRSLLTDRVNQAIKQSVRNQTQLGILLLDLNGFKQINDSLGHSIGDELLTQVAQRLVSSIRATDSAYRYGGDEFIILSPEIDGAKGSVELIVKLRSQLHHPYFIKDQSIEIAASFGFAVYPTDATTQHDLIRLADISMYQDKSGNRRSAQSGCFIDYNNTQLMQSQLPNTTQAHTEIT